MTTCLPGLYLQSAAFRGDACSWSHHLAWPERATTNTPLPYNTRRLDTMVAYAVEAGMEAVARAGFSKEQAARLVTASLSHNGPCIYSEDFFKELLDEANPQLVSPMLFTESVLNIVPTHLTLALGSHQSAYTFNVDPAHVLPTLQTFFMLLAADEQSAGLFCAAEEFTDLARRLIADCKDLPGSSFINGAAALLFSRQPPTEGPCVLCEPPEIDQPPEHFETRQHQTGATPIWSAYSTIPMPDSIGSGMHRPLTILGAEAMTCEQALTVGRFAELAAAAQQAVQHGCAMLVEGFPDGWNGVLMRSVD